MKIVNRIFIIFASLTMLACSSLVQDVDLDNLPTTDSKLVVQCFISPQSAYITAIVTESAPYFDNLINTGELIVQNAIVSISDGKKEAEMIFDPETRLYLLESKYFPILAGTTYYLRVTDGKRTVSAQCTVPASKVFVKDFELKADIDTSIALNTYDNPEVNLKFNWDDIKGERNYYRISAFLVYSYNGYTWNEDKQKLEVLRAQQKQIFRWDDDLGKDAFQSDINLDGTSFSSPRGHTNVINSYSKVEHMGQTLTFRSDTKIKLLSMSILNTDEAYYKYNRSRENADNDNPFAEPTLIYTNITGGLGCFAAYNMSTIERKF